MSQKQQQTTTTKVSDDGVFQRRMGRLAYLLVFLYVLSPLIVVAMVQFIVHFLLAQGVSGFSGLLTAITNLFSILVGFIIALPASFIYITTLVRRLHDIDLSGWWLLLWFLLPFGALLSLILLFVPGSPGANKYGKPVNDNSFLVVLGFKKPARL